MFIKTIINKKDNFKINYNKLDNVIKNPIISKVYIDFKKEAFKNEYASLYTFFILNSLKQYYKKLLKDRLSIEKRKYRFSLSRYINYLDNLNPDYLEYYNINNIKNNALLSVIFESIINYTYSDSGSGIKKSFLKNVKSIKIEYIDNKENNILKLFNINKDKDWFLETLYDEFRFCVFLKDIKFLNKDERPYLSLFD